MPECPHLEQRLHDGTWQCLTCGQDNVEHALPAVIVTRGIDAIQTTDGRPATDWPGCLD